MNYVFNDGGREAAGFKGQAPGDCVTPAGLPYRQVYDALYRKLEDYAGSHSDRTAKRITRGRGLRGTTPRNGVSRRVYEPYLASLGWEWTPTMHIGQGCRIHLRKDELPAGRLIVRVSRHLVAVIGGVIHDTYDDHRDGTRCVYTRRYN
jgi:hypothetical protein